MFVTSVLGHQLFWAFSNSHRPNQCPNNVGHMYPQFFQTFNFVQGGGKENCKNILKRMHCFIREPRIAEKHEYCITVVPRTFFLDCRQHMFFKKKKRERHCSSETPGIFHGDQAMVDDYSVFKPVFSYGTGQKSLNNLIKVMY